METKAVQLNHLTKTFLIPHERRDNLRDSVFNFLKPRTYEAIKAADDLSLSVHKGEFVGIIGSNGAGKSTLLKLIAGVYYPDTGTVDVQGRIAPFIELGVGLHPELSGRDNVFLYGALLGLTRKEIKDSYHDIITFSGLERFMDQKVKNYSSGMQLRLAFSITAQADADIMLIDEVLMVGDALFQAKCLEVMQDRCKRGRTIIFVTHDLPLVMKYCSRVLVLKDGRIQYEGSAEGAIGLYKQARNSKPQ